MRLLIALIMSLSFSSFAHNMPEEIKKSSVIDIMINSEIFDASERVSFETGKFTLDFSELLLSPAIYLDTLRVDYGADGDQDYEEFFFEFKYKNRNFLLNCGLLTEEKINVKKVESYRYAVVVKDCYLINTERNITTYYEGLGKINFERDQAF
jgi:hypothetical protein